KCMPQRRKPKPVINERGIAIRKCGFQMESVSIQNEFLEFPMRKMQDCAGGSFIDSTRFDTNDAGFDDVNSPHAMLAGDFIQALYQRDSSQLDTIKRHWTPRFETDGNFLWRKICVDGRFCQLIDFFWWRLSRII